MTIVASEQFGSEGLAESKPLVLPWRWYYSLPNVAPLMLPLLLLLLRKRNRTVQAWLIFVPLFVVAIVWRTPLRLFGAAGDFEQLVGATVMSLAGGLAAVWLLGDWIGRQTWLLRQTFSLGLMLAAAAIGCVGTYGFVAGEEHAQMAMFVGVSALSLHIAMGLSARCCQRDYRPAPFMLWLAVWSGLISAAILFLCLLPIAITYSEPAGLLGALALVVLPVVIGGPGFGTVIYLVNLPFMVLAFKNPFYRQRFRDMFRLDRDTWMLADLVPQSPFAEPKSTAPTDSPVSVDDIAGTWQFYLDGCARTVAVEFRHDGTFRQTITTTSGSITECPEGTWHLEGPIVHLSGYTTAEGLDHVDRSWRIIDTSSGPAVFGGDAEDVNAHYCMIRQ